jgi:hypothetical protein
MVDRPPQMLRGPLLASARARVIIAAIAVAALWLGVLWTTLARPPPAAADRATRSSAPALRLIVASGRAAPSGGSFDRFDVASQPIVAPPNARGHVAFYASIVRSKTREGIFLSMGSRIVRVAAIGDPVPGGGILSEFAKHPIPALNDADKVAFGAAVTGIQANEGIFLATGGSLKVIALSGTDAPGVPAGTLVEFDTPALNNSDEVVFVAKVRQGRETLGALYLYSGGKLRKLLSDGDRTPLGGTFASFGVPAINNRGAIAFPAVLEHAAVLGGIFLTGTRDLRLLVGAGDSAAEGAMLMRFSERVAINDEDSVALGAHLRTGQVSREAVLLAGSSGLIEVARVGHPAPGGGKFSAFGAWPTLGPADMVAFVAAIDGGPGPLGIYVRHGGNLTRVAMVGERLAGDKSLPGLALNPVATAGRNGSLTFATMAAPETGENGIYYFGPPPDAE